MYVSVRCKTLLCLVPVVWLSAAAWPFQQLIQKFTSIKNLISSFPDNYTMTGDCAITKALHFSHVFLWLTFKQMNTGGSLSHIIYLRLWNHNINNTGLVTPSHFQPKLLGSTVDVSVCTLKSLHKLYQTLTKYDLKIQVKWYKLIFNLDEQWRINSL